MGVIGDIAGAYLGAKAAKKAARAQTEATDKGLAEVARQFDLGRADMAPWREAGGEAVGRLTDMVTPGYDHTTSPGYQFRFSEGQRAVESGGAARGMLMSGGTLKDLIRYGDGVASADYNDQFNRNASIAAGGQQVVQQGAALGAQAGQSAANLYGQQGNARASGYVGQANAIIGGINNANDRLSLMFKGMGG